MIPSWMRMKTKKKEKWILVVTDEQRAILKALADPVENKYKNEVVK